MASLSTITKENRRRFIQACETGDIETLRSLITGVDIINAKDTWYGRSPLHAAVQRGHAEVVQFLIQMGGNINIKNNHGDTPLHVAASEGKADVIKVLINLGASINCQNKNGNTPLHQAALKDHSDVVKLLLEAGANPNIRSHVYGNNTPLKIATGDSKEVLCDWMDETIQNEIRQVGTDAVSIYRKSLRRGTFVSNFIRVMIVGHFGVGKTILVKGILGKENRDTTSTNGIDLHRGKCYYNKRTKQWIVQDKHTEFVMSLDDIVQIDFWDFAGQLIYYTTHQTNFSRRSVYVLVFDLSLGLHGEVEDEDLDPMKKDRRQVIEFQAFKTIKNLIFQNTGDIGNIKKEIFRKFESLIKSAQLIFRDDLFLDALNMTEERVNLLRKVILDVGQSYPEFGESIPASWIEIHKVLNTTKESGRKIISTRELLEHDTCIKHKIDKFELQLFLLYYHDVGYIIYFKEKVLRDHIILDPRILIDAMKGFITCEQFLDKLLDRLAFGNMRKTGKVKRSFIEKVWKITDNDLFYKNREHLFLTMVKLDLLCKPKVYGKDGNEQDADFFYIPCMISAEVPETLEGVPSQDNPVIVTYVFNDIVPPSVFHRLISSCLCLWKVYKGHMYNGQVFMQSGRFHILVLKRHYQQISLTFIHTQSQNDIDVNLCRAIKQFVSQRLDDVLSSNSKTISEAISKSYKIEYSPMATEKHLHVGDRRGNDKKSKDGCPHFCKGPSDTEQAAEVSDFVLMRIASQIPSENLIPLSTNVSDVARELQQTRIDYFQPEADTVKETTADFPDLRQSDLAFLILHKWKEIVIGCGSRPTVEKLLSCLRPEFSCHIVCKVLHTEDQVASHLDPIYQMKEPSKELLDAVADRISTTYLHVGLELNFHCDEILRFRMNKRTNTLEIISEILSKWLQRNKRGPRKPTIAWLATALLNTNTNIQGIVELEYKDADDGSPCCIM